MNFTLLENFMDSWAETFTPGCCAIVYKDGQEVFRHQPDILMLNKKFLLPEKSFLYLFLFKDSHGYGGIAVI